MRARSGVFAALLALSGCVPGFDQFTVVDPADGATPHVDGGRVDGGRDAGTPSCDDALLACASSCEALLEAVFASADFDGDTGDFTLQAVSGSGALEGGALVLSSPETWLLSLEEYGFGTVAGCAAVALTFETAEDTSGFLFGLRGPEHGVLARMRPESGQLQLASFEPDLTLLDASPLAIPTGGASARYAVLVFVAPGVAHAEARRDDGAVAAVHGPYGGAAMPLELELSFFAPDVATARVERVAVGRLTDEARAAIDAW